MCLARATRNSTTPRNERHIFHDGYSSLRLVAANASESQATIISELTFHEAPQQIRILQQLTIALPHLSTAPI